MSTIPEMIERWREKRISDDALIRGIVSYETWEARITEQAVGEALVNNTLPALQLIATQEGKKCLLLFSSMNAYSEYAKVYPVKHEQHFLKMRGTTLFAGPMEDTDEVHLDPLSPHEICYGKEQFGVLRDMATAVMVEDSLTALRHGTGQDRDFEMVRDYKRFSIASTKTDGEPFFLMAPDSKGRVLAAVFTTDEAYEAYLPEAREIAKGAEVNQLQIDGATLLDSFQRMEIDGFVFNCKGPVTPVAFAKGAAKLILES